jgi:hypothetical protein
MEACRLVILRLRSLHYLVPSCEPLLSEEAEIGPGASRCHGKLIRHDEQQQQQLGANKQQNQYKPHDRIRQAFEHYKFERWELT